ncbi:MAG: CaiB/BaiF CoA-transferase family protein, partial [Candidatus Competibacter sp.]
LSLGDTFAGLHAAFGVLLALLDRQRRAPHAGQTVDVALYESVFNLMEAVVPEYDGAGAIREPSGSTVTGIVPTGTYRCRDGKHVIIGGNGDSIYKRLMHAAERADLAEDSRLAHNAGRVEHQQEIDAAIAAWTATLNSREALARLEAAEVPAGPIYSVADMVADPHFQARGLFETVEIDGKPLKIPAIFPKLTATPGATDWPGPEIGRHNAEVFGGLLGLSAAELATLQRQGVL